MSAKGLLWIEVFIIFSIAAVVIVPRKRILQLFIPSATIALSIAYILLYTLVNIFGYWKFNYQFISFWGIPFFIALAWVPEVIIFIHLLPARKSFFPPLLFTGVAAIGAAIFVDMLNRMNYIEFYGWQMWMTFIVSFILHGITAIYFYATGRVDENDKVTL